MKDIEKRMIRCLRWCTFLPGSFEKRFVRDLFGRTTPISTKQRAYLEKTFHRYRKQIGSPHYEEICLELSPDLFELQFDLLGNAVISPVTPKKKPIMATL